MLMARRHPPGMLVPRHHATEEDLPGTAVAARQLLLGTLEAEPQRVGQPGAILTLAQATITDPVVREDIMLGATRLILALVQVDSLRHLQPAVIG